MAEEPLKGFSKIFQQMPAVYDLLGLWSAVCGSTEVFLATISAHDLHARMLPEPFGKGFRAAIFEEVYWLVRFSIDEDRAAGVPSAKSEIVHAQDSGRGEWHQLFNPLRATLSHTKGNGKAFHPERMLIWPLRKGKVVVNLAYPLAR